MFVSFWISVKNYALSHECDVNLVIVTPEWISKSQSKEKLYLLVKEKKSWDNDYINFWDMTSNSSTLQLETTKTENTLHINFVVSFEL